MTREQITQSLCSILRNPFVKYLLVGAWSFLVDYSVMETLIAVGAPTLPARVVSMCVAIGTTYILHRKFTFGHRENVAKGTGHMALFSIAQCAVAFLNFCVFTFVLFVLREQSGMAARFIAFCAGTCVGLLTNYAILNKFLFREKKQ